MVVRLEDPWVSFPSLSAIIAEILTTLPSLNQAVGEASVPSKSCIETLKVIESPKSDSAIVIAEVRILL